MLAGVIKWPQVYEGRIQRGIIGMSDNKEVKKKAIQRPPLKDLEGELQRERYKTRYRRVLRSTVFTLITVAAVAILVATLWMPVLQIYGASMSPTLTD